MTVSEIDNQRTAEKMNRSKDWLRMSYRELESLRKNIGKPKAEVNLQKHSAEVTPT